MIKSSLYTKISIILVIVLLIGVMVFSAVTTNKNQKFSTSNRASGTGAYLSFVLSDTFQLNQTRTVTVKLNLPSSALGKKLDAFKTIIVFPKGILNVENPDAQHPVRIRTGVSGFPTIMLVDTPTIANQNGTIHIVLSAGTVAGAGPATALSMTIAQIDFKAISTGTNQVISIDNSNTQIVTNDSVALPLSPPDNLTFSVSNGTPPPASSSSSSNSPPPASSSSSAPTNSSSSSTSSSSSSPSITCICKTDFTCDLSCTFTKQTNTSYTNPLKCSLEPTLFGTIIPNQTNKNSWCDRLKRTMGDTDGDGVVTALDLGYYSNAVNGRNIPVGVNPDIDGDGRVSVEDRNIIIKSIP